MAERRTNPWIAFAAGAVVMLAVALLWFAWQGRDEAGEAAASAVDMIPEVKPPSLPGAPRLPEVPIPIPK